jgi:hypothetical protein
VMGGSSNSVFTQEKKTQAKSANAMPNFAMSVFFMLF